MSTDNPQSTPESNAPDPNVCVFEWSDTAKDWVFLAQPGGPSEDDCKAVKPKVPPKGREGETVNVPLQS